MLRVPWYMNLLRLFLMLFVALLIITCLYPLFWMFITSFKTYSESLKWPPTLLPRAFLPDNYILVFQTENFGRYFLNSIIVSVTGTVLTLLICSMAGYGFAKFHFPGRNIAFMLILATMMIPGQVTLIPVFLLCKTFGWLNTYMGLIIPGLGGAFGIFMVRQFAVGIPNDFIDAARVDGAGESRIYLTIFLPLIAPVLSTLAVLSFMGRWNDLFWPLIVVNSKHMRTLQLALTTIFRTIYDTHWPGLSASMVLAVTPILALYVAFQKYFTRGIVLTSGVKG